MAGTTTSSHVTSTRGSDGRAVAINLNKLVDDVEVLRAGLAALAVAYNAVLAKLDADGGVTDTDFVATGAVVATTYDAAGDLTAAKVGNKAGTAITA